MPPLVHLASNAIVNAASGAEPRRSIAGTLMPYGVVGRARDGQLYRLAAGALRPARESSSLTLGHDLNQPIGVLASLDQRDGGVDARYSIDTTPDGDTALTQAASGSRACLSAGFEPLVYTIDASGDEPIIDVAEALLHESALVTIGAFEGAAVSRVAATAPQGGTVPPLPTAPAAPASPAPDASTAPGAASPVVGAGASPPVVASAATPPELVPAGAASVMVVAEPPRPAVTATQLVAAMVRAARGDVMAQRLVQAAMAAPSHVADNAGVLPPTYVSEIQNAYPDDGRPLWNMTAHRPMPDSGMSIEHPTWVTKPDGGWMADDTASPASNTPKIGLTPSAIVQWAYVFSCSLAVYERSSPDWAEAVFGQSIIDYHNDVEARIAALLPSATGATGTPGEGIAALFTRLRRGAGVLVMAPDQFGVLFDRLLDRGNADVAGSVSSGAELQGSVGGLRWVISGSLPVGYLAVGVANSISSRETNPIRLTANVIGAMNVELGISSFFEAFVDVEDAFEPVAPLTNA